MIDYRSDTVTKPTPGMLQAMMEAKLGDDVFGEDPTVNALEEKVARMFGMEAALFCPSGTMCNQISLAVHGKHLEQVICDEFSHIYQYEAGAHAFHAGVSLKLLRSSNGLLELDDVVANINPEFDWLPTTKVVWIENTSNKSGGNYYTPGHLKELSDLCKQHKLVLHLDGARLFNALVETSQSPAEMGQLVDSLSFCLSKGLGAPVGSVMVGSAEFIKQSRRVRKAMGGGMRQAGFLAAAGIYALDNHIDLLKADHEKAQRLAASLSKLKMVKTVSPVSTNIIMFELTNEVSFNQFMAKMEQRGIGVISLGKNQIRIVTHLDITEKMVLETLEVFEELKVHAALGFSENTVQLAERQQPDILFGRFSDAYKSLEQNNFLENAKTLFEEKEYLRSYQSFFSFLQDQDLENVIVQRKGESINFKIIQGSKTIIGEATKDKVYAETEVVRFKKPVVGFMRKLMELNFGLQYCRFAIIDDKVVLKFNSSTLDGSPNKIYFALRELAINADKQDDLLADEFSVLELVESEFVLALSDEEKMIKYKWLHSWISETLKFVKKLDANNQAGGITRTLLNLAYKIDYLIIPQGRLMERLNTIYTDYFSQSKETIIEKNENAIKAFERILKMTFDEVGKELYRVKATFGLTQPTAPAQIESLINEELRNIEFFKKEKEEDFAIQTSEYIAQYSVYYFGIPQPMRLLLHLLITVHNSSFLKDLGFDPLPVNAQNNKPNKAYILSEIKRIQSEAKLRYPKFRIVQNHLKFDSILSFSTSFLGQIKDLNFSENDETKA